MRVLCISVLFSFIFLGLAHGTDTSEIIDCGYESNEIIKIEKDNMSVICNWYDSDHNLNYLIERKLDKKAITLRNADLITTRFGI